MSVLLSQLARIAQSDPLTKKIIFVPSAQFGINLSTALAREGFASVNVYWYSPRDAAARIAVPQLIAAGRKPLDSDAMPFVVRPLLERLLQRPEGAYLIDIGVSRGLVARTAATIGALRSSGVAPSAFPMQGGVHARHAAIAWMYQAYLRELDKRGLFDDADVLSMGAKLAPDAAIFAQSRFYVLDGLRLSGLDEAFIRSASGGRLERLGTGDPADAPPATACRRFGASPEVEAGVRDAARPQCRVVTAVGAETGARGIIRDILARRIAFDDVEIVYTSEQPYLATLVSEIDAVDGPLTCTFSQGVPIRFTRPGLALGTLIRWIRNGYPGDRLVALLRSGLITFKRSTVAGVETVALARFVLDARLARGRSRFANVSADDLSRAGLPLELLAGYQTALRTLADLTPPDDELASVAEIGSRCVDFLKTYVSPFDERDAHVIDSLQNRLVELAGSISERVEVGIVLDAIEEMISTHKVEARSARPGAIHVSSVDRAGYTGRPFLYVLGMEEGSFPGGNLEDPLLLDEERIAVGVVSLQSDRPRERSWHLRRALDSSRDVSLIAVTTSLTDNRDTYPSPFFEEIRDELEIAGDRVEHWSIVPPTRLTLDDRENVLVRREQSGAPRLVLDAYPWLARGKQAQDVRTSDYLTQYDGIFTGSERPGAPWPEEAMSASGLEALAACPYRHFLRKVLRVVAPDEPEISPSIWLDHRSYGLMLHDVFRDFMRVVVRNRERVSESAHSELMRSTLEHHIERWKTDVPPPTSAAFERQRNAASRATTIFLRAEEAAASEGLVPVAFEERFGPIDLRIDHRAVTLRGRIDRIDESSDGYHVWDYKTGSASAYSPGDLLADGTRLQWALYAHALQAADGRPVVESGYVFTSDRESGKRISAPPPSLEHLSLRLTPLLEMVEAGLFPKVQKFEACRFCDYAATCSSERIPNARWKVIRDRMVDDEPHSSLDQDAIAIIERWMTPLK